MLNQITLIGRLTKEPELFRSENGVVANFYLAFNQGIAKDGSEETGFIRCKVFNKTAEVVSEWLTKGDKIVVSGLFKDTTYTDKNGNNRHESIIHVDSIEFVDVLKSSSEEVKESEKPQEVKEEPKPVAKPTRSRR